MSRKNKKARNHSESNYDQGFEMQNETNVTPPIMDAPAVETTEAPTEAPQLEIKIKSDFVMHAPTTAPVPVVSEFKAFIDRARVGTAGEQMVVTTLEAYIETMSRNVPLTIDEIVREQSRLYGMFKNIGRRTDDFKKSVVVARAFFKEYYHTVFHDTKINRGHEALNFNADERKAFYSYLQFYKILASVNDLKDVKKSVAVTRSLNNPVIPTEVLDRYVALIN